MQIKMGRNIHDIIATMLQSGKPNLERDIRLIFSCLRGEMTIE